MRKTTPPADYVQQVAVLLRDDDSVLVDYGAVGLDELKYRCDYAYRDTLALAEKHGQCIGFSHWYRPSGANNSQSDSPVWRWSETYRVLAKYKVGRGGSLRLLS